MKSHHLETRLVTAILIGCTLAVVLASPARASIVRADNLNIAVSSLLSLDIDGNGTTDLSINNKITYAGMSSYSRELFYGRSASISMSDFWTGGRVSAAVNSGTLIGPGSGLVFSGVGLDSSFANYEIVSYVNNPDYYVTCGLWGLNCHGVGDPYIRIWDWKSYILDDTLGDNVLIPFSFGSGNQVDYGWLDLSIADLGAQQPYSVVLNGYGYDDSGNAVLAGSLATQFGSPGTVPEPGTLALLGAAFGGLTLLRRRNMPVAKRPGRTIF